MTSTRLILFSLLCLGLLAHTATALEVIHVDYQIREVNILSPSDSPASTHPKPASETFVAAVFTAHFDEPVYLSIDHSAELDVTHSVDWHDPVEPSGPRPVGISLFDVQHFMKLRHAYRQVLYGLTQLRCPVPSAESSSSEPSSKRKRFTAYPSFPSELRPSKNLKNVTNRRVEECSFPNHLMPLPQAKYQSFQWFNVLGQPEYERANTTSEGAHTLSMMLLLRSEHMYLGEAGERIISRAKTSNVPVYVANEDGDISKAAHDQEAEDLDSNNAANNATGSKQASKLAKLQCAKEYVVINADNSVTKHYELLSEEIVPQCAFDLLPHHKQKWVPKQNLTNFVGEVVSGVHRLQPAHPAHRSFHYSRDNQDNVQEDGTEASSDPSLGDINVFLGEHLQAEHKAKFGLSIILAPVIDKLMAMVTPYLDRVHEYTQPYLSKGLILIMDGKFGPGTTQPSSSSFPGFLEIDSSANFHLVSSFRSSTNADSDSSTSTPAAAAAAQNLRVRARILPVPASVRPPAPVPTASPPSAPVEAPHPLSLRDRMALLSRAAADTARNNTSQTEATASEDNRHSNSSTLNSTTTTITTSPAPPTESKTRPSSQHRVLDMRFRSVAGISAALSAKEGTLDRQELRARYESWREHVTTHPEIYSPGYALRLQEQLGNETKQSADEKRRKALGSGLNGDLLGPDWIKPRLAMYFEKAPAGSEPPKNPYLPRFRSRDELEEHLMHDPLLEDQQFERLRFEQMREMDRLTGKDTFHTANLADGPVDTSPGNVPLTITLPGPWPQKLIGYFTAEVTSQMTPGCTQSISDAVEEDILDVQQNDMRDALRDQSAIEIAQTTSNGIHQAVTATVPTILHRSLPPALQESLTWTITNTLIRALTHSVTPTLALFMSRPVEEEFICSQCFYYGWYCDMCSWTPQKRTAILWAVDYLADYYSDMYADHWSGGPPAPNMDPPKLT